MSDELKSLFDKARFRSEERGFVYGLVGRHNVDTTISYAVPGRADFLYVTVASKTVIIARNDAGVPQIEDYPVKLRKDSLGIYVILGRATNSTLGAPSATPPAGVPPHAATHQHGGSDEIATATPGANAIVKADADGKIGAGWIDDTDINLDNVTEGTTNKFFDATEQSKLAGIEAGADVTDAGNVAAAIDGSTVSSTMTTTDRIAATIGGVLRYFTYATIRDAIKSYYDSVAATLTNKTLDSTNISTLTSKTTPIDADSVVLVDSAATNFFKRVTGTNLKAYFKTYFDTLYNLYVHPNHTGDVTSVADGATAIGASKVLTAMIADDNVTYAKIQNVSATDKVLGRSTAGAGNIEEIALTAYARSLIDDIDAAAGRTTLGLGTMALAAETAYALLAGRAGGQSLSGGNAANEDLILNGTGHATKTTSYVALQSAGGNVVVGDTTGGAKFNVKGTGTGAASAAYVRSDGAAAAFHMGGTDAQIMVDDTMNIVFSHQSRANVETPNGSGAVFRQIIMMTGEVGFGTSTPTATEANSIFTIQGSKAAAMYAALINTGAGSVAQVLRRTGTTPSRWLTYIPAAADSWNLYSGTLVANVITALATGEVGIQESAPTGNLSIKAGASTSHVNAGGVLYTKPTSTGNVGAGLDVLATCTIPANILSANGMTICFVAQGRFSGTGSNMRLAVDFGAAGTKQIFDLTTFEDINTWLLEGEIMRTGAATQVGWCKRTSNGAAYYQSTISLAQTLSSAVVFTIYGESTAGVTDEVILDSLKVWHDDQHA